MLVLFVDYQYTQKTNGIFKYRKLLSSFFASKEDVYCINVLLCAKQKKTNSLYCVNNEIFVPYDILIQNQIGIKLLRYFIDVIRVNFHTM